MSRRYPKSKQPEPPPRQYMKATTLARYLDVPVATLDRVAASGEVDSIQVMDWRGQNKGKMRWWLNAADLLKVWGWLR